LLGQIPLVQGMRESGDSGLPAVMKGGILADVFETLAETLARQIAIRNATFATPVIA
jgi:ATP-binding protein involved in chromosome partitioning